MSTDCLRVGKGTTSVIFHGSTESGLLALEREARLVIFDFVF